jgi:hypothetical protein
MANILALNGSVDYLCGMCGIGVLIEASCLRGIWIAGLHHIYILQSCTILVMLLHCTSNQIEGYIETL